MEKGRVFLAKPFDPSVEAFESVGIRLEKTRNDDLMSAILPAGWGAEKEETRISNTVMLFDEKGRKRVYSYYIAPKYQSSEGSFTWLYPRYVVGRNTQGGVFGRKTFEVFLMDMADEKIIFSAGKTNRDPYDYATGKLKKEHELVRACADYASKHFSDWENPLAYWD